MQSREAHSICITDAKDVSNVGDDTKDLSKGAGLGISGYFVICLCYIV